MNKSRNWQEDKTLCEEMLMNNLKAQRAVLAETPEMPLYWLQQCAAEKERGDKAEKRLERHVDLLEKWNDQLTEYEGRIRAAEAREKKLREAIEDRIRGCITIADYNHADALEKLLASLYPKEEEAK